MRGEVSWFIRFITKRAKKQYLPHLIVPLVGGTLVFSYSARLVMGP